MKNNYLLPLYVCETEDRVGTVIGSNSKSCSPRMVWIKLPTDELICSHNLDDCQRKMISLDDYIVRTAYEDHPSCIDTCVDRGMDVIDVACTVKLYECIVQYEFCFSYPEICRRDYHFYWLTNPPSENAPKPIEESPFTKLVRDWRPMEFSNSIVFYEYFNLSTCRLNKFINQFHCKMALEDEIKLDMKTFNGCLRAFSEWIVVDKVNRHRFEMLYEVEVNLSKRQV